MRRRTGNGLVRTCSSRTVTHSWKISQLHRSSTGRALKTHQAYFWEIWRLQETDPALLGHTQNLSCSQSLGRVSGLKDLGQTYLCISGSFLEKQEAAGTPARDGHWQATFRVFPVADECQGPAPSTTMPLALLYHKAPQPDTLGAYPARLCRWSATQPPIMESCLASSTPITVT